jgi:hypothetical protein
VRIGAGGMPRAVLLALLAPGLSSCSLLYGLSYKTLSAEEDNEYRLAARGPLRSHKIVWSGAYTYGELRP